MNNPVNYNGYVVYGESCGKVLPFGIVTDGYRRKAITNYVPNSMVSALIAVEDKRFFNHGAIDIRSIVRAIVNNITAGRIVEGGSTLTQQLARNLMFDFKKTVWRKTKEILFAFYLEIKYSKEKLICLYFENVYWGGNIYGLRAASLAYFSKEPCKLSHKEQLALLTILRGPNHYLKNPSEAMRRYTLVNRLLVDQKLISSNRSLKNIANAPSYNITEIGVISNSIIPYVVRSVSDNSLSIQTTINLEVQKILDALIADAPFPLSAVVVRRGRVISIGSAFGRGYPAENKTNVGSTLKPFIYTFLRESGIERDEVFDATCNTIGLPVREAYMPSKSQLSLSEALFVSNNNTFINASSKVGMDKTLDFISSILCIDRSNVFPSSILGATKTGLSLVELALLYYNYFGVKSVEREETLCILNRYQESKLGYGQANLYLKTGTTNDSRECYAILGNPEMVLAFMRNENAELIETSKGISIIAHLRKDTTKELINRIITNGRVSKR